MLLNEYNHIISKLKSVGRSFWLGGGYSIDVFLGRKSREHDDFDIIIKREDQLAFQDAFKDWDLQVADPPGSGELVPWKNDEFLTLPLHNIWGRKDDNSEWELEFLISEFIDTEWVYRRNSAIRGKLADFGMKTEMGIEMIRPEIQLLYKSRSQREKDIFDFQNCLKLFSKEQKERLRSWIKIDSGSDHPWLNSL